jgi:hypothetical protein
VETRKRPPSCCRSSTPSCAAWLGQEAPGHTLQPTALVHEAYLRLTDKSAVTWESRKHFFFAAARAMRDILVEQARRKAGPVRGGGRRRQELDEACTVIEPPADYGETALELLALHTTWTRGVQTLHPLPIRAELERLPGPLVEGKA